MKTAATIVLATGLGLTGFGFAGAGIARVYHHFNAAAAAPAASAKPAPKPVGFLQTLQDAGKAAIWAGSNLVIESEPCQTSDFPSCAFKVDFKGKDDGSLRTAVYRLQRLEWSCEYKEHSKIADAAQDKAAALFDRDARKKFESLGFAFQGALGEPEASLVLEDEAPFACQQNSRNTFLLERGGRLYTADFSEVYYLSDGKTDNREVSELQTVSSAPKKKDEPAPDQ